MPGWTTISDMATEVELNGKYAFFDFRKVSANAAGTVAGSPLELFQGTGNPGAMSFSGTAGTAVALNSSTVGAIPINGNVSTDLRFLLETQIAQGANNSGLIFYLCDLLLYYPSLNINASPTTLNNGVTLPRYTNGIGVQCIVTTTTLLATSAPQLTFTYTDSANNSTTGIMGAISATSPVSQLFGAATTASFANTTFAPFLPMGSTGQGVKHLDSYALSNGTATGSVTALLVKPLMAISSTSSNTTQEKDMIFQFMSCPQILDGACLGVFMINGPVIGLSSPFTGRVKFGWG